MAYIASQIDAHDTLIFIGKYDKSYFLTRRAVRERQSFRWVITEQMPLCSDQFERVQ